MSFNYAASTPQTVYTPAAKPVYCKSFKIDLAAVNATTAVEYDLGWLPKDSQVMFGALAITTAVSGPSVTAATIQVKCGNQSLWASGSVFAAGVSAVNNVGYFSNLPTNVDQKLTYTLTLTGGASATAGVIYVNVFYVA
jgi:hypothetical protein